MSNTSVPRTGMLFVSRLLAALFITLINVPPAFAGNVTVWGINGKPDDTEYGIWDAARTRQSLDHVKDLGTNFYRIAFTVSNIGGANGNGDPAILGKFGNIVQLAHERQINLLLIVWPRVFTTTPGGQEVYQYNYDQNYEKGRAWATEAIKAGRINGAWTAKVTHFELGNELAGAPNFLRRPGYNGSDKADWSEGVPNAREALTGALHGLYWGIKGAYKDARDPAKFNPVLIPQNDQTEPTILYGDQWMHFGFLDYIYETPNPHDQQKPFNFLPADVLSWHWYSSFGAFANGAMPGSPISYLYKWNKDIWLTEFGRTRRVESPSGSGNWYDCGGSMNWFTDQPVDNQWVLQANEMAPMLDNFTSVTGDPKQRIKGIFAYELYDWHVTRDVPTAADLAAEQQAIASGQDPRTTEAFRKRAQRSSQGYYGMIHLPSASTYQYKNAFDAYKSYITNYKNPKPTKTCAVPPQ